MGEVSNLAVGIEGGRGNKLVWMRSPGKHKDDIRKRKILPSGKIGRFERDRRVG